MNKKERKLLGIFIATTPYADIEQTWGFQKKDYEEIYKKVRRDI